MRDLENDSKLESAVLHTLAYFDLFSYPLTSAEVHRFLKTRSSSSEVEQVLQMMALQKQIARDANLFALQFNPSMFERRRNGNAMADSLLPKVKRQADLIFQFPFVRSVMASGSLSKNFMDEKSDFDFFIVCAPRRIWISRMLLVLYKRIFLRNSHKYLCVNYFVDEAHLEIGEKNIFTATELATVLPLNGLEQYNQLIASNTDWLTSIFPNFEQRPVRLQKISDSPGKRILESVFTVLFASQLNRFFKWVTIQNWKRLYSKSYSANDFKVAFKSTDSVSKNHPRNFQKKILELYEARLEALNKKNVEVV